MVSFLFYEDLCEFLNRGLHPNHNLIQPFAEPEWLFFFFMKTYVIPWIKAYTLISISYHRSQSLHALLSFFLWWPMPIPNLGLHHDFNVIRSFAEPSLLTQICFVLTPSDNCFQIYVTFFFKFFFWWNIFTCWRIF